MYVFDSLKIDSSQLFPILLKLESHSFGNKTTLVMYVFDSLKSSQESFVQDLDYTWSHAFHSLKRISS